MATKELDQVEWAALVVLMAESANGPDITNRRLRDNHQVEIDKALREKLRAGGFVEAYQVRTNGPWVINLEESGRKRVHVALAEPPLLASVSTKMTGAALRVVARVAYDLLQQRGKALDEWLSRTPPDLEEEIRTAYGQLVKTRNGPVLLSRLRHHLAGVSREDLDHTLITLYKAQRVDLQPRSARAELSAEDEAAAMYVGGETKHQVVIVGVR